MSSRPTSSCGSHTPRWSVHPVAYSTKDTNRLTRSAPIRLAPPQELKARNISHARNLFDRAVTLLPRIDQVWYKYVFLEELLGNVAGARQVFERWMAWEPNEKAWSAYIKMEVRYQELDRASKLYERLINCHPEPKHFVKWAKFEEERGNVGQSARNKGNAPLCFSRPRPSS